MYAQTKPILKPLESVSTPIARGRRPSSRGRLGASSAVKVKPKYTLLSKAPYSVVASGTPCEDLRRP